MSLLFDSATMVADQVASELLGHTNDGTEEIRYEHLEDCGYLKLRSVKQAMIELPSVADYLHAAMLIRVRNIKSVLDKLISRPEVKILTSQTEAELDPIEISHRLLSIKALFRDCLQREDKELPRYQLYLPQLPSNNREPSCQQHHESSYAYHSTMFESDRNALDVDYCDWFMSLNCETNQFSNSSADDHKSLSDCILWKSQTLRRYYAKKNQSTGANGDQATEVSDTEDSLQKLLEQIPSNKSGDGVTNSFNEMIDGSIHNEVERQNDMATENRTKTNTGNGVTNSLDYLLSSLDSL